MYRTAAMNTTTMTALITAAMPVFTRAEVLIPRRFSHVNTAAKTIFHPQTGSAAANSWACCAHHTVQIRGLSM